MMQRTQVSLPHLKLEKHFSDKINSNSRSKFETTIDKWAFGFNWEGTKML